MGISKIKKYYDCMKNLIFVIDIILTFLLCFFVVYLICKFGFF